MLSCSLAFSSFLLFRKTSSSLIVGITGDVAFSNRGLHAKFQFHQFRYRMIPAEPQVGDRDSEGGASKGVSDELYTSGASRPTCETYHTSLRIAW